MKSSAGPANGRGANRGRPGAQRCCVHAAHRGQGLANDMNVTAVACFTTQGESAWLGCPKNPATRADHGLHPQRGNGTPAGLLLGNQAAGCSVCE